MNLELLKDGCLLMLIGMGSVFIFIQIMIWFMELNAGIITWLNKKFPEVIEEDKYTTKKKTINDESAIALALAIVHAQIKKQKI